jgi:hypothetical protein
MITSKRQQRVIVAMVQNQSWGRLIAKPASQFLLYFFYEWCFALPPFFVIEKNSHPVHPFNYMCKLAYFRICAQEA